MKGKNGKKILKLFDYFKIAFAVNTGNKQLYKPQVIYLILRGILILLSGLTIVDLAVSLSPFMGTVDFTTFLRLFQGEFLGTPLLIFLVTLLVLIFGSTYVEAGLYAMYAALVDDEGAEQGFATGANRYFLSFLGGNLLIAFFWILAAIPYFILGFLTLTLGFVWLPIIVSAMLMVWKAALVTDDEGVFAAIGASLSFGKRHFIPANVFIILKSALSSIGNSSSGSGNISNNMNSGSNMSDIPFNNPPGVATEPFMGAFGSPANFDLTKAIYTGIAAVAGLASIGAGLIHMIFEIFFGLTAVIIYKDDWQVPEEEVRLTTDDMEVE